VVHFALELERREAVQTWRVSAEDVTLQES